MRYWNNIQPLPESDKRFMRDLLGEDISQHILCWNILEFNFISFNMFTNEVMLDVDVLSMWVIDWIVSKGDIALIVDMNDGSRYLQEVKFSQKSPKPDSFLYSIWRGHILHFNKQSSNSRLLLRRLWNSASSNFEHKASNRVLIIQILSLIQVCLFNQIKGTLSTSFQHQF